MRRGTCVPGPRARARDRTPTPRARSEEHTSELQSQSNLVCRLLLEKTKVETIGAASCGKGNRKLQRPVVIASCKRCHRPRGCDLQPYVDYERFLVGSGIRLQSIVLG